MNNYNDDHLLADSLRSGDKEAFEYVFDTYYQPLVDYAWRIVHDDDTAQDIVQSFFLKLYDDRETLTFTIPLKYYFFSSVYRRALNEMRHQKVVNAFVDQTLIDFYRRQVVQTPDEEVAMRSKEIMQYLDEAVEALPSRCREIYRMKYERGMTNQQIAELFDISSKTVEAQTTKALSRLRKDLEWLLFLMSMLSVV